MNTEYIYKEVEKENIAEIIEAIERNAHCTAVGYLTQNAPSLGETLAGFFEKDGKIYKASYNTQFIDDEFHAIDFKDTGLIGKKFAIKYHGVTYIVWASYQYEDYDDYGYDWNIQINDIKELSLLSNPPSAKLGPKKAITLVEQELESPHHWISQKARFYIDALADLLKSDKSILTNVAVEHMLYTLCCEVSDYSIESDSERAETAAHKITHQLGRRGQHVGNPEYIRLRDYFLAEGYS